MDFVVLQIVKLTVGIQQVPAGTTGTIVEAYRNGRAFIFECTHGGKHHLLDVTPEQIEPA